MWGLFTVLLVGLDDVAGAMAHGNVGTLVEL